MLKIIVFCGDENSKEIPHITLVNYVKAVDFLGAAQPSQLISAYFVPSASHY